MSRVDDWNDGYWTEGLDRLSNLASIAEVMLINIIDDTCHPAIERAGLQEETHKLVQDIYTLYQKLGAAIPEEEW